MKKVKEKPLFVTFFTDINLSRPVPCILNMFRYLAYTQILYGHYYVFCLSFLNVKAFLSTILIELSQSISINIEKLNPLGFQIRKNVNTVEKEFPIFIIVQRDATQSGLFIILQVHSTCFGCQPHPSSGVHKTVTKNSGIGHIFVCSYLPPTWPNKLPICTF